MNLNHFQLAEVKSHIDAELGWIIDESVEAFRNNPKNVDAEKKWYPWALYKQVGKIIADTIAEREGFREETHQLTSEEAGNILFDCYREAYPDKGFKWTRMSEWIEIGLERLIARSLLRTRAPLKVYDDGGYWPYSFGEGGFCNPMKLKMMDD